MKRRDFLAAASLAAVMPSAFATRPAFAKYPERPIRLIIPRAPGGALDVVGRPWATRISPLLGPVYVDNIGGGGGITGTTAAARAQPDGYTLLFGSTSDLVLNPLIRKVAFDPVEDFQPVSLVAISIAAIAVNASVPVKTLQELVDYAKTNKGKLSYASGGTGTLTNLAGELFKRTAGLTDLPHIPYKGVGPGLADLISGIVPVMAFTVTTPIVQLHNEGKIRILAVASDRRLTPAPDIPTAKEAGYPDLIAELFLGVFAPKGTPSDAIEMVSSKSQELLLDKGFQQSLIKGGVEPTIGSTPASTAAHLKTEITRWTPVLDSLGMKAS